MYSQWQWDRDKEEMAKLPKLSIAEWVQKVFDLADREALRLSGWEKWAALVLRMFAMLAWTAVLLVVGACILALSAAIMILFFMLLQHLFGSGDLPPE